MRCGGRSMCAQAAFVSACRAWAEDDLQYPANTLHAREDALFQGGACLFPVARCIKCGMSQIPRERSVCGSHGVEAPTAEETPVRVRCCPGEDIDERVCVVWQIDWAKWEADIQRPGLVAAFKAAHQSVPTLTCSSPFTSELETGFAALISEAEQAGKDSDAAIAELEGKLEALRAASDWENIQISTEADAHPDIKREIAQDLEKHKWFTI